MIRDINPKLAARIAPMRPDDAARLVSKAYNVPIKSDLEIPQFREWIADAEKIIEPIWKEHKRVRKD